MGPSGRARAAGGPPIACPKRRCLQQQRGAMAMTRVSDRPVPKVSAGSLLAASAWIVVAVCSAQCLAAQGPGEKAQTAAHEKPKPKKEQFGYQWKSLFDGKTLKGWKVPKFGGDGEVKVESGEIVLGMGDPMTGITWAGDFPRMNYEVTLEGKRTKGIDFFCSTTFPVGKDPCSFIVGGWAGTVVGLSCVDWYDASDNATSRFMAFKDNQWYKIRIRVSDKKIECWIDDEKMVDLVYKNHKISIRDEMELCRPFGIATWCTEGRIRNIRVRRLRPEEVAEIPERPEQ
ncbi:MAG TPA: DUF1080 domain-containing protein [Planctomycetes bacterium]|nr:DUF1080 domain-containing protein [Planctomycetota bacterium]